MSDPNGPVPPGRVRSGSPPTLLVLRALGLGDLLTGVPALRALAEAFPAHRRVLAAPASLAPLVVPTGLVHEVEHTVGLTPLRPPAPIDVAVDLHGRGPESQRLLVPHHPRRLLAFAHPEVPRTRGGPRWRPDEHEVHRWCRMLCESGVPAEPQRLDLPGFPPPPLPGVLAHRGATLVHPGAAAAARRWPVDRFAAVARAEVERGQRVVVTAGPGEESLAAAVREAAGIGAPRLTACGPLPLGQMGALVAACGRVVCGDTGVAHLATAVGTPSVVLFGPVPPALWGPPAGSSEHRALWAGRSGDPHGAVVDPGLLDIGVDEVIGALTTLPERRSAPLLRAGP